MYRSRKSISRVLSVIFAASFIVSSGIINSKTVSENSLTVFAAETQMEETPESLVNYSHADKNDYFFGETINVYGQTQGGTGDITFAYYYKPSAKESWSKITEGYVKDDKVSFVPKNKGTYDVKVQAKDSNDKVTIKIFSVNVSEISVLKNTSSINAKNLKLGETVRIAAKRSGGKAKFSYAFYYKRRTSPSWYKLGEEFGEKTTAAFQPISAGVFDIRVDIKDASGQLSSKSFTVSASNGELTNVSDINRYLIKDLNSPIRMYGVAAGGSGEYKYAYYYKRSVNTRWISVGTKFGTQTEARFYPAAYAGYDARIDVQDGTGKIVTKTFSISAVQNEPLENNSALNKSVFEVGEKITISGTASGGNAPYKYTYRFRRKGASAWKTIGSEDTSSVSADITPVSAGEFEFQITVKDSSKTTVVKELSASVYKIENLSELESAVVGAGDSVTVKASAQGGQGDYLYSYYLRKKGVEQWDQMGNGMTDVSDFVFTASEDGEFEILVKVTDGSGLSADKVLELKVYPELKNISDINKTIVEKGKPVILYGAAEGGTGEYTYAYFYMKAGNNDWYWIGSDYSDNPEAKLSPSSVSVYYFKVIVKDSLGKTAEKIFTVTVKASSGDELPIVPAI